MSKKVISVIVISIVLAMVSIKMSRKEEVDAYFIKVVSGHTPGFSRTFEFNTEEIQGSKTTPGFFIDQQNLDTLGKMVNPHSTDSQHYVISIQNGENRASYRIDESVLNDMQLDFIDELLDEKTPLANE